MECLWCKKLERNACLASRKFIQDPRLIGCDSAKRDSRRTSRNDTLCVRPKYFYSFVRSFAPQLAVLLRRFSNDEATRNYSKPRRALWLHAREKEREREK